MTTTEIPPKPADIEEDPRFRDRRLEVLRAAGRKRTRIAVAILAVVVVAGFAYLAVESPALDVDHVRVVGVENADRDEILRAAGPLIGHALLRVDTGAIADRVENVAWVADAHVVRKVPGTLRIEIREHNAVAYARRPNGMAALLAADGRVVADVDAPPPGVIPILGMRRPPPVGDLVSPPDAPGVVTRLPDELAARVSAIDLAGAGVALDLVGGGEVRLGSLDELDAKAAAALAVLAQLGETPFEYIDVRVPQTPAVK